MGRSPSEINWISISVFEGSPINNRCWYHHRHTPDSSGKPAGCAAPEDLERIAGLGPEKDHPVSSRLSRDVPPLLSFAPLR